MKDKIIVATRPSLLAYTQTQQTVKLLQEAHPQVEFEIRKFSTQGDRDQHSSLTSFGGTGVFVKELEHALLVGEADIAVHSLKDVPSQQPEGLCLAGFPPREDARDVLIIERQPFSKVGTGSPRRLLQCALEHAYIEFIELRGNIETRLKKMKEGDCDATFLAAAGLKRLGIDLPKAKYLNVEQFIPAIGQGVLALECRASDEKVKKLISTINDKATEIAVMAERAFMQEVEGGCKFPLAAHAYFQNEKLRFLAIIGDLKSHKYVRRETNFTIENITQQAAQLAREMLEECKEQKINLDFNKEI